MNFSWGWLFGAESSERIKQNTERKKRDIIKGFVRQYPNQIIINNKL